MSCQGKAGLHVVKPLPQLETLPDHASSSCPKCGDLVVTIRGDTCECRCGYRWRWLMLVGLD